ncbi:MAG: putative 2-dehydropantoate 2-reductase [Acidimicrobiales bacterium]
MEARRYAVVGTGAIGGLYGARLADAGHPVHFVARSDLDHLRTHGLTVESPYGDVRIDRPSVVGDTADLPDVDVVIVAVKTTANDALPRLLAPLAAPGRIVVVLQNGLGVEAAVARAAPGTTVVGGMCFTCSNKVGPGHVHHLDYGAITLGEWRPDGRPAGTTAAMQAVSSDMVGAGIEIVLAPDLSAARWRKLVWNMPFNGLSVLHDATTAQLLADPDIAATVPALMDEVCESAAACGSPLPPSTSDDLLAMTHAMSPYETSMKLDAAAGRRLELDAIYGAPLAAAHAAGARTPRLDALHAALRDVDDANGA